MSNARDELAWEIFRVDNAAVPDDALRQDFPQEAEYALHIAEGLLEAGFRKPRTITTAAELDALPEGAVIRDNDGDVFEAVRCTGDAGSGFPDYNCWDQIAETWPLDSDKIVLPVTVLDEASK